MRSEQKHKGKGETTPQGPINGKLGSKDGRLLGLASMLAATAVATAEMKRTQSVDIDSNAKMMYDLFRHTTEGLDQERWPAYDDLSSPDRKKLHLKYATIVTKSTKVKMGIKNANIWLEGKMLKSITNELDSSSPTPGG